MFPFFPVLHRAWWCFFVRGDARVPQDMKWQMDQNGQQNCFRRVTVKYWVKFHIQLCSIINCLWLVISYLSISDDNIDSTLGISYTVARTLVKHCSLAKLFDLNGLEPIQVSTQGYFLLQSHRSPRLLFPCNNPKCNHKIFNIWLYKDVYS